MTFVEFKRETWAAEGALVRCALVEADWNLSEAARRLELPITSLVRVLERHPSIDQERRAAQKAA